VKIVRSDARSLVIVDFPYLIGAVAFPCALFLLVRAILFVAEGGPRGDVIGCSLGGLMFFMGGAVFTKRSAFEFDLVRRRLTWSRRGLFTRAGGTLPIDEIRSATVQSLNNGDTPTYRVALLTAGGKIPLTDAYSGGRQRADAIRSAINDALKLNVDANVQVESDILELARAGRTIDAVKLTRERYGYDLAQAKQFVDELRGEATRAG
jgi:hypothetical protein